MTYEEAISELVVIKSVYSHMRGEYKPCVEALQMAIDLLRQADTPQTDKDEVVCPNCGRSDYIRSFEKDFNIKNSEYRYKCINCNTYIKDTPQTDRPCDKCEWHKEYGRCIFEYCHYAYEQAHKDTPQTDCSTCKWGEWYRNGRDITTMDDECGGCCSWNNKWTPKETQTDCGWR